jgi:sulfate adenylyltransferase (ADP) / ATP adenylyltransferase
VDALPFQHRCALLGNVPDADGDASATAAGAALVHLYGQMMAELGLSVPPPSYNLLLTQRWMLLVPRTRSDDGPVSVNSLGFAGTFLVKGPDALQALRDTGPLRLLARVGVPRP